MICCMTSHHVTCMQVSARKPREIALPPSCSACCPLTVYALPPDAPHSAATHEQYAPAMMSTSAPTPPSERRGTDSMCCRLDSMGWMTGSNTSCLMVARSMRSRPCCTPGAFSGRRCARLQTHIHSMSVSWHPRICCVEQHAVADVHEGIIQSLT